MSETESLTNPSLQTDRLLLKGISPSLIHELHRTQTKEQIMQFFGFDEAGYEKNRTMHEKGMETHALSLFFFLLINKENNMPIGECGFHTWNRNHQRAEVFYHLRHDSDKQKGYMSEALPLVLAYGFKELGLKRIEALVADWNVPSVSLLHRQGFTKEGTLRGHYFINGKYEDSDAYSLLVNEWNAPE